MRWRFLEIKNRERRFTQVNAGSHKGQETHIQGFYYLLATFHLCRISVDDEQRGNEAIDVLPSVDVFILHTLFTHSVC